MPKFGFKVKGLNRLTYMIDPQRMDSFVRKHMKKANKLNGIATVARIRDEINGGSFEQNAPLTQMIKGENKPLVGASTGGAGGQLFQSISWKEVGKMAVFAGILKTDNFYNIGRFIHEGGQIEVTSKMRSMFSFLWYASLGLISGADLTGRAADLWKIRPGGWKPLKRSTNALLIPSRPFIPQAMEDSDYRNIVKKNWEMALAAAHAESSRKAGKGK